MTTGNNEERKALITVVGIGPGGVNDMTVAARRAIETAEVVVGYSRYIALVKPLLGDSVEIVGTGMKQERDCARQAIDMALSGRRVAVVSSGDASIYGMAPLIHEMRRELGVRLDIEVVPGISAFQKAASLLGAPVGHDFCVISLSDLMTPWEVIERRIRAAAIGDFVTAVYNPRSNERYWQLHRLKQIFLREGRAEATPVGYVRNAGRKGETVALTTLKNFNPDDVDMFTVVLIGNSQSYEWNGAFITPRGYYGSDKANDDKLKVGQDIMMRSFTTIEGELRCKDIPLGRKWALLHAIHTTADFDMENILWTTPQAVEAIYNNVREGRLTTIVTDVTMVVSGIRKGALQRLGVAACCYLADPRVKEMAERENITRTQAGIRLAVADHPDALFAFGNAPTALMELCSLVRKGKARPQGIIAAPVGFVHVKESKYMAEALTGIPMIVVEGRKGGSNLAATLCNAVLCFDDAEEQKPGRDL